MSTNPVFVAGREIQQFIDQRCWRCCVIGGLAVVRWGQPRATRGVDISLMTELGEEEKFIDTLLATFAGRGVDPRRFAIDNRVVLLSASNGVDLDIALAAFPYEERVIERATPFDFAPGVRLVTASAEDMVILKSFAGRDRDWDDVRGVLERQSALNWNQIERELTDLCQLRDDLSPLDRLAAIRREVNETR